MLIAVISFQIQNDDVRYYQYTRREMNHKDTMLDMRFCHPASLERVDNCAVPVITYHSQSER